jgi:excisionase family DNA binding protein
MGDVPAGEWLTAAQAAEVLGVSRRRVNVLAKAGRLPAVLDPHGYYLIRRADAEAYQPLPTGRPRLDPGDTPPPAPISKRK